MSILQRTWIRALFLGVLAGSLFHFGKWTLGLVETQFGGYRSFGLFLLFPFFFMVRPLLDRPSKRAYSGIANLVLHIHRPPLPGSVARWILRSVASFVLFVFGGRMGPEGFVIEMVQGTAVATRGASSQWFEQLRRTDIACTLAAGVSVAFGAPFAGMVLPMELSIGGRYLAALLSSIAGFVVLRVGEEFLFGEWLTSQVWEGAGESLQRLFEEPYLLLWLLGIGVGSGVLAVFVIRLTRQVFESFHLIFARSRVRFWWVGLSLLMLAAWIRPSALFETSSLLEGLIASDATRVEVIWMWVASFLMFTTIVSFLGSAGVLWPLLGLGGLFAWIVAQASGFGKVTLVLVGGTSLIAATLGAPLTGALLAFEVSHNFELLIFALLCSGVAVGVRKLLRTRTLIESDLESHHFELQGGRSKRILESIKVEKIMRVDYQSVRDNEDLDALYQTLKRSPYPFVPVVDRKGAYLGILTADVIEEAWEFQAKSMEGTEARSVAKILEAKDLLYGTHASRLRTVQAAQALSELSNVFDHTPVLPVVDESGEMRGLIFAHDTRIAYDAELARQSLQLSIRQAIRSSQQQGK